MKSLTCLSKYSSKYSFNETSIIMGFWGVMVNCKQYAPDSSRVMVVRVLGMIVIYPKIGEG
jgi:hypothetical protein